MVFRGAGWNVSQGHLGAPVGIDLLQRDGWRCRLEKRMTPWMAPTRNSRLQMEPIAGSFSSAWTPGYASWPST